MAAEIPSDVMVQYAVTEAPFAGLPQAPPLNEYADPGEYSRWQRLLATGAILATWTCSAVVTAQVIGEGRIAQDRLYSFSEVHPNEPLPQNQTEAPAPSPEARALVEKWLAEPTNPKLKTYRDEALDIVNDKPELQNDLENIEREMLFEIRENAAAKFGLTVFNAVPTLRAMDMDRQRDQSEQMSTHEYIDLANEYLAQFGLQIAADSGIKYSYDLEAAALDNSANSHLIKSQVSAIVDAYSRLPAEYVRDSGIKHLLLAQQKPNTKMRAGAYIYFGLDGPEGAAYVYNTSSGASVDTTFHELWHRWDYLLSGGAAFNDPGMILLNNGAQFGNGGSDIEKGIVRAREQGFHTVQDFWDAFSREYNSLRGHVGEPDCLEAAIAATVRVMNIGNMTVFVSSYAGQSNVGEQKAELGVDVQSDSYTVMMNEWLPLIHAQFKREMSRLADYRPAYVGFFIAMSEHTNNPRKDADDQDYFIQLCFTPRKGG